MFPLLRCILSMPGKLFNLVGGLDGMLPNNNNNYDSKVL